MSSVCAYSYFISKMEGLLQLENILSEQPTEAQDFGEPWQIIHNKMQSAIGIDVFKISNKAGLTSKNASVTLPKRQRRPIPSQNKVQNIFSIKQAKNKRFDLIKAAKRQQKLAKIKRASVESMDKGIFKIGLFRGKGFSENKENKCLDIAQTLSNVQNSIKQRTASFSLLNLPGLVGNHRKIPSIYRNNSQQHKMEVLDNKMEVSLQTLQQLRNLNHNRFFQTQACEFKTSKLPSIKPIDIVSPLNIMPVTQNLRISYNQNQIALMKKETKIHSWTNLKPIHSLDYIKKRNQALSFKLKHQSLQRPNPSAKELNYDSKKRKSIVKQVNQLRQIKHRLHLNFKSTA